MIGNLFSSARRSLMRDRVYVGIAVGGLAVGLWAALLSGLMLHQQLSFEHFMDGHEDVHQAIVTVVPPDQPATVVPRTASYVAQRLQAGFPTVVAATRLLRAEVPLTGPRGTGTTTVYWADMNALDVLRLPLVAGDRAQALSSAGSIVLPRSAASRLFGPGDPIGERLRIGDAVLTVTAIAEDLPPGRTRLESAILVAGHTAGSPLAALDTRPGNFDLNVASYVRLAPGSRAEAVWAALPELVPELIGVQIPGWSTKLEMIRLDRVPAHEGLNPGFRARIAMLTALGGVTLLIAVLNFVNLTTARAGLRVREIGVRKAAGASRGLVVLQFLAEASAGTAVAALLALALAEWSLPQANALLDTQASLRQLISPRAVLVALAGLAAVVFATGAWPALLLWRLRPIAALGARSPAPGGSALRGLLVAVQFSMLIGLSIAAGVMWLQRSFALREALRADATQVLVMRAPCPDGFVSEVRRLEGVRAVACGSNGLLTTPGITTLQLRPGEWQLLHVVDAEPALLRLLGIRPLAGSLDERAATSGPPHSRYVINDTARRRLGFRSNEEAIGPFEMPLGRDTPPGREIVAIVPEFSFASVVRPVEPLVYLARPDAYDLVFAKLAPGKLGETIAAIDATWRDTAGEGTLDRFFINEHMQGVYRALHREMQVFGLFSVLALLLSCVGLLGLSIAGAQRRAREVAVRKALGAHPEDIMRLLLRQSLAPVLWASLIGWPVAALAMQRWLEGFAYHVTLPLWLFPLATAIASLLAAASLFALVRRIANAPPARGLRHE